MEQEVIIAESGSGAREIVTQALGAVKRRRWWVLLTTAFSTFLALAALPLLPKKYTSDATLVVVRQQVPERYVTPTATTDIGAVLETAAQEVLSRTRLLAIIADFDLYPQQRLTSSPEALAGRMRKQISIEPILSSGPGEKTIDGFKISFTAENPHKAQAVTSRLTQLFIAQNLETREHQAAVTTGFLKEELEAAKAKLSRQEQLIRDFKMQNLGELPEQQNGNLSVLSSLQSQLQNLMSSEAHAQEQQVYLQSLLNGYRSLVKENGSIALPGSGAQSTDPIAAAQVNLASLRAKKATLSTLYTPEYPGIIALNSQIAQAEAELKALRAERAASEAAAAHGESATATANSSSSTQLDASMAPIKSQLEANRLERENLAKEEAHLKEQIAEYQKRLNLTPVREQQLADLMRDYELMKADYADLLNKETQSQLAGSLEKRQEGQQFRLVDSASLPVLPSFPKPLQIGAGGLAGGLALGLALAFLWDKKDGYFYREEELSRYLREYSVVSIPVLRTKSEERARKWRHVFEWAAGSALVAVVLGAEVYELFVKRI